MLAALEHGVVENLTKQCNQITAIYSSIPGHINRTAGHTSWDQHGPRYILDNDTLLYAGHFDDSIYPSIYFEKVLAALKKSRLSPLYLKIYPDTNNMQKNVFIQIIKRSEYYLRKINKKSKFIIVFWNSHDSSGARSVRNSDFIQQNIQKEKFEYYLVGDILNEYNNNQQRYSLSQHDTHPNHEANKGLAIYLATKIKKER